MLSPGHVLAGTYEILGLLGEGGMGHVYEAIDRMLDRRVAIKVARATNHVRQLRNESKALAAFQHRSLVTVYTLGAHESRDFLVMERIYGIHLADHIQRRVAIGRPVTMVEAVDMMANVAEGLAVVHRAGLAHRDVKLENVMLTPDGRVVLMDFGLVLPEHNFSTQNTIAGSPPYMAPETLANAVESGSGHLVDLYALGVCLFELLTGKKPIVARSLAELLKIHQSGFVPALEDALPAGPARLHSLVASLMAKAPADRPQSADAVAWQLCSIRDRELYVAPSAHVNPDAGVEVLLVDDDPDILRILEFYVRKALPSVSVRVARDGVEAMTRLEEYEPDFMLLDLHMPRMNGIDVCMQMRSRRMGRRTTVISVSAGAQEHDRQLMHQLGIHHFVEKGATLRERLTAVLRELSGLRTG